MDLIKRKQYSDLIELFIVIAFLFMIITIYVPSAIWVEEKKAADDARFNIQTVHDVESVSYTHLTLPTILLV